MRKFITSAIAAASLVGIAGAPQLASAHSYHHYRHHGYHNSHNGNYASARHEQSCESARRRRANTGTVIGGLGGALAGNALSHGGGKLGGTLIGGGVGAVVGHTIADRRKGDC